MYVRRSDLSPDGQLLVYSAATHGGRTASLDLGYAWTAVSTAPSLRPHVHWAKEHSWFGGGLFNSDDELLVNEEEFEPRSVIIGDRRLRLRYVIRPRGEDEPVYGKRLSRDGWRIDQESDIEFDGYRFTTHAPEIRSKTGPLGDLVSNGSSTASHASSVELWLHRAVGVSTSRRRRSGPTGTTGAGSSPREMGCCSRIPR
jgi:hypothetical protein